jgi:hypothetical protein
MTSHIVGVKDHVLVATITSKIGTSLFARGDIKTVAASVPAGREARVGHAVVAISSSETTRRELDRRAIGHEKDRGEQIRPGAV